MNRSYDDDDLILPGSGRWWARLILGAVLLLASAIAIAYLAARFIVWPNIDTVADRYAGSLQQRIGVPVAWRAIDSEWTGLRPRVGIDGLAIGAGDSALRIERVSATLSLRQILAGRTEFKDVVVESPVVHLIRDGDSLRLAGSEAPPDQERSSLNAFAAWLLQQPDIRIASGTVVVTDAAQPSRSLRLEQVGLVLKNAGLEHDLRIDVARAGEFAADLTLQAALDRTDRADPGDWRRWAGRLQSDARQVSAAALFAQLPGAARDWLVAALPRVDLASLSGRIDSGLALQFDGERLVEGRLRLRGDDLSFRIAGALPAAAPPVALTRTHLDLRVVPGAIGGYELTASLVDIAEAGGARLRSSVPPFGATFGPTGELTRLAGRLDVLDVGPTLILARRLADRRAKEGLSHWVRRLTADGRVSNLEFDWRLPSAGAAGTFAVKGGFEQATLQVAPSEQQTKNPLALRVPGFRELSGSFSFTEGGGDLALRHPLRGPQPQSQPHSQPQSQPQSQSGAGTARGPSGRTGPVKADPGKGGTAPAGSQLSFGGALAEPDVAASELDAQLSWRRDAGAAPGAFIVRVDRFGLANADGRIAFSGTYRGGGTRPGVIDLRGRVDRLQASRIWRYLPAVLAEPVRHWARDALEAGSVEAVDLVWNGEIDGFPYRKDKSGASTGQFRIAGKVRDVLFKYASGWPAAHGVQGDLVFEGAGMRFAAERGSVLEVPLTGVSARIEDLARARLVLDGRATGDAAQMLKFINDSPLVDLIGDATRPLIVRGPTVLELSLRLPLVGPERGTVAGRAEWTDGTFEHLGAGVRVDDVAGRYEFTEKSLALTSLNGRYLGSPIAVSGRTAESGALDLRARGTIDIAGLKQLVGDHAVFAHLKGATRYEAVIGVDKDGTRIDVDSDLAGLASDLPSPMAKSIDARWPLSLQVKPRPGGDRIDASLRGEVLVAVERDRADPRKPLQIARAAVAINRQPTLPDQGFSLQYTGQRLDLDEWLGALAVAPAGAPAGAASGAPPAPPGSVPITVSLLADEVRVGGRNFNKVVLGASRHLGQWSANLAAREINGHLSWSGRTIDGGKLTARLGRLEIPASQRSEAEALAAAVPTGLPALDVTADRFVFAGLDFGALALVAANQPVRGAAPVWKIERLRLTMPSAEFEAQGEWNRSTSLSYRLNMLDAGATLDRLQIKDAVKGGVGALSGQLTWSGSPTAVDLATLGGSVDITIRAGQFLKVEPGAAKLISVLNLQALPRLLSLDFSDIFAQGFSFDELRGNVLIRRGVATTDSLAMRGLQAVVTIKGAADLRAGTQDLRVVVLPELNGGLASLAFAAIVNPAVGLGALLAQSVLREPLSRAFAYEIDVTGPWANPTVVQRKREPLAPPPGSDASP